MAHDETPNGTHVPHDSGLSMGSAPGDAVKVMELEDQVRTLAEKANNASQRFADYENEIRVLQAQLRQEQRRNGATAGNGDAAQTVAVPEKPTLSRFGSLMHTRKASPSSNPGVAQTSSAREKELESELAKERTWRIAAETKLEEKAKKLHAEMEEMSAALFQEANEMVSNTRREKAGVEEELHAIQQRVAEHNQNGDVQSMQQENTKLRERLKIMEQRDADRRRRLEKLDAASKRIERVRTVLIPR